METASGRPGGKNMSVSPEGIDPRGSHARGPLPSCSPCSLIRAHKSFVRLSVFALGFHPLKPNDLSSKARDKNAIPQLWFIFQPKAMRNRRKGEISGLERTGKEPGQEKMSWLQQRQDWKWLVRSFGLVRLKNRDQKIYWWIERNWYKIKTGPEKFHPTSTTRQEEASLSSINLGEIRNHTKRGPEPSKDLHTAIRDEQVELFFLTILAMELFLLMKHCFECKYTIEMMNWLLRNLTLYCLTPRHFLFRGTLGAPLGNIWILWSTLWKTLTRNMLLHTCPFHAQGIAVQDSLIPFSNCSRSARNTVLTKLMEFKHRCLIL